MKPIHLRHFTSVLAGLLLAAASPAQTPVTGSIGMTVKNAGAGSRIVWLAPEAEKVLGFDESGQLTVLAAATAAGAHEPEWGSITGALADQADLQSTLAVKAPLASPTFTGTVTIPGGASIAGYLTETDAGTRYASLTGSYTDPPWITTLAKSKVGLGSVENTALSTWTGSSTLATVGTLTAGTWQGNAIADSYIASASNWNSKANQDDLNDLATLAGAIDTHLGDLEAAAVKGPDSATDNALARYDGTTGKLIQSSLATLTDGGDLAVSDTIYSQADLWASGDAILANGGHYLRSGGGEFNVAVFPDKGGVTRRVPLVADTGGLVDVSDEITGTLPIANGGTGAASASTARTQLGLVIGTDVLAPSGNGASLTSLNASALSSGTVGTARLGSGTASSTTFLRGDGVWATPAGGGTVTSVALSVPAGLTISGSPITTSGTLTLSYTSGYTFYTTDEQAKLSGIEDGADITDPVNVAEAGAVMESDASTASMSFVIDEDSMSSDSATKVPTQQSVKAYVDAHAGGGGSGGGIVLQRAVLTTTGKYSATGIYPPLDDTVPQRSELADLDLELTITPQSSTSELWLEVYFNVGASNTAAVPLIGVFQTGSDDAKAVFVSGALGNINYMGHLAGISRLAHPGQGVATTVEFRLGHTAANATMVSHINRSNNTSNYGTATVSTVRIIEIETLSEP